MSVTILNPTTQKAQRWITAYIEAVADHKTSVYDWYKAPCRNTLNILDSITVKHYSAWRMKNFAIQHRADFKPRIISASRYYFTTGAIEPLYELGYYYLHITTKNNDYYIPLDHIKHQHYNSIEDRANAFTLYAFTFEKASIQ